MTGELSYAQAKIPDIRFGVASYSDYPYSYSYCGYYTIPVAEGYKVRFRK